MRLAKLLSVFIGVVGVGVIATVLFVIIPNMGGHGFTWLLIALILLAYALVHIVPAAGLLMPWLLDRLAPRHRRVVFLSWLASVVPILAFDAVLWFGHRPIG